MASKIDMGAKTISLSKLPLESEATLAVSLLELEQLSPEELLEYTRLCSTILEYLRHYTEELTLLLESEGFEFLEEI